MIVLDKMPTATYILKFLPSELDEFVVMALVDLRQHVLDNAVNLDGFCVGRREQQIPHDRVDLCTERAGDDRR